jgi:hypothetical protein
MLSAAARRRITTDPSPSFVSNILRMSLPVQRIASDTPPAGVEISESKLQDMIAAVHGAADFAGRRSALRVPVEGFALMSPLGTDAGAAHRVGVYDLSRSGIAVVDSDARARGDRFNILFPRAHRRPIEVLCTVRHCRANGAGYIIGAEFGVSWLSAVGSAILPPAT